MLLQAITVTNSPLSPKSPNECGLNVFSLFFYAGMHGLCCAGQLYIPLFLYILSVTATVALSLFVHPSQSHSRRQAAIHRVNSYSEKSGPVSGASTTSTGNYQQNHLDSTIRVRSPRGGINKRSVDYFVSLPEMARPLILTNRRGFSLRVRSNGQVFGTLRPYSANNIPNNIPDMLLYILKVSPERSGEDRQLNNDAVEIVIRALHSNRYVCMDFKANVYTQKMVNKSITFDCIWQLRSNCLGASISSSYYPQPIHYIKNTGNIKRWYLAIDRYGNIRNGNKTKGRRVSSIWRVSPSASAMNLPNDRHVMNAMVRDGIELKDPRKTLPRQRMPAGILDPKLLRDDNRLRESRECLRIKNALKNDVQEDIKKSQAILNDANITREEIVKVMKDSVHYTASDLKRFRRVYNKWIENHWFSYKWRKQGVCIRNRLKHLKRRHNKRRQRHLHHQIKNLEKSLRIVEEDLSDWRLLKRRMKDFIKPLTFIINFSQGKNRTRIHDIIRKKLHIPNLHSFKQIRWAVYVDRNFNANHAFILKYGESKRLLTRRHSGGGSCWKLPGLPIKKSPKFSLHKWHRHLPCVKEFDRRLKQLMRREHHRG